MELLARMRGRWENEHGACLQTRGVGGTDGHRGPVGSAVKQGAHCLEVKSPGSGGQGRAERATSEDVSCQIP